MNERIKHIADALPWSTDTTYEELQTFAEIIIRECKALLFESSENNLLPIAVDDMLHIIDTHFGVNE